MKKKDFAIYRGGGGGMMRGVVPNWRWSDACGRIPQDGIVCGLADKKAREKDPS